MTYTDNEPEILEKIFPNSKRETIDQLMNDFEASIKNIVVIEREIQTHEDNKKYACFCGKKHDGPYHDIILRYVIDDSIESNSN